MATNFELIRRVALMYVSRHIYLLGGSLVNVVLGLYLQRPSVPWRQVLQWIGSGLILLSPVFLCMAFLTESPLGISGRGWRSSLGLIGLFVGVMTMRLRILARAVGAGRIDTTCQRP